MKISQHTSCLYLNQKHFRFTVRSKDNILKDLPKPDAVFAVIDNTIFDSKDFDNEHGRNVFMFSNMHDVEINKSGHIKLPDYVGDEGYVLLYAEKPKFKHKVKICK